MSKSPFVRDMDAYLNELLWRYNIPGASVAILVDGKVSNHVAGITNTRTGYPVTPDTIFLIGSITKVLTTTLVMQLVDEGVVELDNPVVEYLPDLKLSSEESTKAITVRHLLNHTNGIAGDYMDDFGRGDDAIERYVRSFDTLEILHKPGELFSYSNSAFMLAGYLIERLTNQSWHRAIRERLLNPLGMSSTVTLPEEALRFSTAIAHKRLAPPQGGLDVGEMWSEFHAGSPAGFTPYATPTDLLKFADLHLNRGRTRSGKQLLSETSVAMMQETTVNGIPSGPFDVAGWGLGWILNQYSGERVIGHNGGSSASLRVLPDRNAAVAVLTNASGGVKLAQDIIGTVVGEEFGLSIPNGSQLAPGHRVSDLSRYEGRYQHLNYHVTVSALDGQLQLIAGGKSAQPGESVDLIPLDDETFIGRFRDRGNAKVSFVTSDEADAPDYVHIGLRAYRRIL